MELDGRLILKDRALKSGDTELYNDIDKLNPDAVEYLVRTQDDQERSKLISLNKVLWGITEQESEKDYADSDGRSYAELPNDGGGFWDDIDTRLHVTQKNGRVVTKENMSSNFTRLGDPRNFNDLREGY